MVLADRLRLEQVIINLLRNALDATKEVGEPRVELILTAGKQGVIMVRDNGPGIKDFDSIFEPFYTTRNPARAWALGLRFRPRSWPIWGAG